MLPAGHYATLDLGRSNPTLKRTQYWDFDFRGNGLSERKVEDLSMDALERDLSVREVEASVLGQNNRLFVEQAHRHGFDAAPMRRYDRGCKGSGMCLGGHNDLSRPQ